MITYTIYRETIAKLVYPNVMAVLTVLFYIALTAAVVFSVIFIVKIWNLEIIRKGRTRKFIVLFVAFLLACLTPDILSSAGVLVLYPGLKFFPLFYLVLSLSSIIYFFVNLSLMKTYNLSDIAQVRIPDGFLEKYGIQAREKEVMMMAFMGLGSKEIAARLNISYGTARNYLYSLYKKTKTSNKNELFELIRNFL